jgi:hypothetical protein
VAGASYSVAVDLQDGVQTNFDLTITAVPTVRITNPITGTNFPSGASVDLQIEATDSDGMIVRADFQTDSCTGTSTTSPFGLHCNNLSPGSYTLTATVTDDSGATATADPVTFTVGRPSNDDFANRIELDGALVTTNSFTPVASREPGEPYHAGYMGDHSVWWSWTPPVSGNYTLSTEGSTCDTLLAVYLGSSISNLTPVAADSGSGGASPEGHSTSRLSFDAFSTNTYVIAVDGRYDGNGEIAFSITPTPISIRIDRADTGIFLVRFSSGEGQQVIVEASDDLIQWAPICTNTITGGTILFSDLHGTEFAHRFYRAIIAFEPTAVKIDLESADSSQVQLQTNGGEGSLVVIEASDDIGQWIPVGTNRIIDGRVTFSGSPGTNWPHRFFRVRRPK